MQGRENEKQKIEGTDREWKGRQEVIVTTITKKSHRQHHHQEEPSSIPPPRRAIVNTTTMKSYRHHHHHEEPSSTPPPRRAIVNTTTKKSHRHQHHPHEELSSPTVTAIVTTTKKSHLTNSNSHRHQHQQQPSSPTPAPPPKTCHLTNSNSNRQHHQPTPATAIVTNTNTNTTTTKKSHRHQHQQKQKPTPPASCDHKSLSPATKCLEWLLNFTAALVTISRAAGGGFWSNCIEECRSTNFVTDDAIRRRSKVTAASLAVQIVSRYIDPPQTRSGSLQHQVHICHKAEVLIVSVLDFESYRTEVFFIIEHFLGQVIPLLKLQEQAADPTTVQAKVIRLGFIHVPMGFGALWMLIHSVSRSTVLPPGMPLRG
ncbi:hypothetical protein Pcinc_027506 [Petrolisthes cinctipes]|uniref:Uncharacterized protein n=1 Tax=Petrolisthes cinctipes TaxID=88211 RepID=A0AAE1F4E7_PETCI|nr:hypothetical protein Pcinc_027506 [Petrolisthes cinctipes]